MNIYLNILKGEDYGVILNLLGVSSNTDEV
jgi:hypothetical protein